MILGLDTSNYTTSAALYDGNTILQQKRLLQVKAGARGLRQSEAVFQHTLQLPAVIEALPVPAAVDAIGVSTRPRNVTGSYMPCFLVGHHTARALAHCMHVPLFTTSHQVGHILAALYSAGQMQLIHEPFLAFHVSGGTTEALFVQPHRTELVQAEAVAQSLDLKAGQLIDRTGVRLGLSFPCGPELEKLALQSTAEFKIRPSMRGADCSLSGVENKVQAMLEANRAPADIALFVLESISKALESMVQGLQKQYGTLPLVFAGGVLSNSIIKANLAAAFHPLFAEPSFSSDNAAGTAVFASLMLGNTV